MRYHKDPRVVGLIFEVKAPFLILIVQLLLGVVYKLTIYYKTFYGLKSKLACFSFLQNTILLGPVLYNFLWSLFNTMVQV
jgi:hypothetical protein